MSRHIEATARDIRIREAWANVALGAAPKCPTHKRIMVPRVTRSGEPRPFWGCPRYPDCSVTKPAYGPWVQMKSSPSRRVAFRTGRT